MKTISHQGRFAIVVLALLALVSAYRLSRHSHQSSSPPPLAAANDRSTQASPSTGRGFPSHLWSGPRTPNRAGPPLDRSAMLSLAADAKNVSVNFWGKVVDQEGAPVSGVRVRARIRHWQLEGRSNVGTRFIIKESMSGADGRFEIIGGTGDVLTFEALVREGYEPEPTALRGFGYNISTNIVPDPKKPMEMRLWKTGSREPVLAGNQFFGIIPDGRVYTIDLVKGTHIESADAEGDLRIRVKRPLEVTVGKRYDWSFQITPMNGGIMEVWDDVYLASADGYSSEYAYSRRTTDSSWGDTSRKQFVFRTRGGQVYGRARFHIFASYDWIRNDGAIDIKYSVNPAGSRKLF